ncbi:MAG TPA: hypothetical protein EYP10_09250, partial [Armatimonadetes bacterium]|nr:hypothetical protein [Armatimonadota bacterium]
MSGAWVYNTARISDSLAMVIPVWFSSDVPRGSILQLLCDSLMGWEAFVRPENLVLVVDGEQPHVEWALERLRGMLRGDAWRIEMLKTNLGKGGAVAHGIECALAGSDVQCVVIRDADNDHLLADLPPMVTVWQGVCEALRTCDVVVVGARHNLTAPLGWLRAQWETFLNHLIMQVVSYCRHRQGDAPCW